MISASEEELLLSQANPDTAVQVIAGGYLAALGVFHELHCLVRPPAPHSLGAKVDAKPRKESDNGSTKNITIQI